MKKAFTLAEVMITLTVIGIIAAVSFPVAMRSKPNENIMKFKKAHATLYKVISELISSDKYFCNGDLGMKADCTTQIVSRDLVDIDYFCNAFADLLSIKKTNCTQTEKGESDSILLSNETVLDAAGNSEHTVTAETIQNTKNFFDAQCKKSATTIGAEIVTTDGTTYYQTSSRHQFGSDKIGPTSQNGLSETIYKRYFSEPNQHPANFADEDGFDIAYKIFCIDIDGIPDNASPYYCSNTCPFGYGIRADGKILPGKRAEEWIKKDMTDEK